MHKKILIGLLLLIQFVAGCERRQQVILHQPNAVPEALSEWHLLTVQKDALTLNAGVVPYDLNSALFTDYAHKLRTLWLPDNSSVRYGEEAFDYPLGTILSKTFYYPKDADGTLLRTADYSRDFSGQGLNLNQVTLVETRLLVKRSDSWQPLVYVWNQAQTEAVLEIAGDAQNLQMVDIKGARNAFTYIVPNTNQCAACHMDDQQQKILRPLGPKARYLNKNYRYQHGSENQLAYWQRLGWLHGLPQASAIPRAAEYNNADLTLEARARAYLDINCGHCHNPTGSADTSGLMLHRGELNRRRLGLCKPPIAAGVGTGNRLFSIAPGSPEESIVTFRMESTDPGAMMPELGRSLIHDEGVTLLREWIASMPGDCS